MTAEAFSKILAECSTKGTKSPRLVPSLISALPCSTKNDMIKILVQYKQPILYAFLNEETDMSWLSCMGYLYTTKSRNFGEQFLHLADCAIK